MKKVEEKQTKTVNQKAVLHSIAMILWNMKIMQKKTARKHK